MNDRNADREVWDADVARGVALEWMTAVCSGDEETALRLSATTIVYTNGGHLRHYEGHDGIRDIVEDFSRLAGFLDFHVIDVIVDAGMVAIRRVERYTLPEGGVEIPACSFVEVSDGLVTRWSDYKDLHPLNKFSA